MPGRPKPTKLKIITGNPGKRPLPKNEPDPVSPLPDPPAHLDDYARDEWNRLAAGIHAIGLLYEVDRGAFAGYCMAYSRWRRAEEEIQKRIEKGGPLAGMVDVTKAGNIIQNVLVGIANKAAADMVNYAREFGMTPQARARLGELPGTKKRSKFDGLIGGKTSN